jgi:hypothetical protein
LILIWTVIQSMSGMTGSMQPSWVNVFMEFFVFYVPLERVWLTWYLIPPTWYLLLDTSFPVTIENETDILFFHIFRWGTWARL